LIAQGINRLRQRLPDGGVFCDALKLMLKFSEHDRPSFCELLKFLTANSKRDLAALQDKALKASQDKKDANDLAPQTRLVN